MAADHDVALGEQEDGLAGLCVVQIGLLAVEVAAIRLRETQVDMARAIRAIGRVRVALAVAKIDADLGRGVADRRYSLVIGLFEDVERSRPIGNVVLVLRGGIRIRIGDDNITLVLHTRRLVMNQLAVAIAVDGDLDEIGLRTVILDLENAPAEIDRGRSRVAVGIRHRLHELQQIGQRGAQRRRVVRIADILVPDVLQLGERHLAGDRVDLDGEVVGSIRRSDDLAAVLVQENLGALADAVARRVLCIRRIQREQARPNVRAGQLQRKGNVARAIGAEIRLPEVG